MLQNLDQYHRIVYLPAFKKILGFEPYNTSMLKKAYFQCQGCLAWFADLSHLVCWVVLTARELLFVVYCVGFAEWCLNCHVCRAWFARLCMFGQVYLVRFAWSGLMAGVHKIFFVWYPTFFQKNLSYDMRDCYYQKM